MTSKRKPAHPALAPEPKPELETKPKPAPEVPRDEVTDALKDDPTLEMEFEPDPEPETKPDPEPAPETQPSPGPTPSGMAAVDKETEPAPEPDPAGIPVGETVILNGPASFGPVMINGQATRCRKGVLYHVPDVNERVDILATGRFRGANAQDKARASQPSAGPGGALTRDKLPAGAIRGGLTPR